MSLSSWPVGGAAGTKGLLLTWEAKGRGRDPPTLFGSDGCDVFVHVSFGQLSCDTLLKKDWRAIVTIWALLTIHTLTSSSSSSAWLSSPLGSAVVLGYVPLNNILSTFRSDHAGSKHQFLFSSSPIHETYLILFSHSPEWQNEGRRTKNCTASSSYTFFQRLF